MMLAASLHSVHEGERQMLFEHLDRLCEDDMLLLDRGYPARWLVILLNQRGIRFCMRVENGGENGFAYVRDLLRLGLTEPNRPRFFGGSFCLSQAASPDPLNWR